MAWKLQLCFGLFVTMCVFWRGEGGGKMEVMLVRFQSSCTDHAGLHQCDTYFKFCIDKQRTPNINTCHYKYKLTGHYENDNTMDFGSDIQGVDNPLIAHTASFKTNGASDVMFVMEAWDKDAISEDDHVATLSRNLDYTPADSQGVAQWTSVYKQSGSSHVWFKYRFYCDPYYYTHKCDLYCKSRDDSEGHYTCIKGTGQKKCMRGWTGENCTTDIDECQTSVCYHNATCSNQPGWYSCDCPQGYAGQNCDLVDSMCHSSPCQNGGTCTGTMQGYNCTCPVEWQGQNCETQVDFCQSSPCLNNATCYATLGNYTCACALGWTGYHCMTEVHACDSSPCENGGSCTNQPHAEYSCTCPADYEGEDCQTLKNPCDPNPCHNSGTCVQLTYDTYNCTCVYGWEGDNCSDFLDTTANTQAQSGGGDEEVDWLPIVLAIISAIVIVAVVVILFYFRRRRLQKKADQELRGDVLHVAGSDNLAFRNALYDQTNRANSVLEARGNRPPLPVPSPPPPPSSACATEDVFNFTKPKVVDDEEELGAVGGSNPYQDIDGYQPAGKYVDMGKGQGKEVGSNPFGFLDTRTLAGGGAPYNNTPETHATNHYADFEDLRRRSVALREAPGYANTPDCLELTEDAEVNHYQDLDDVLLDIQTSNPDPALIINFPPTVPTASHYDNPRSLSSDVTPAGNDGTTSGNDVTSTGYDIPPTRNDPMTPEISAGDGYMAMEGTSWEAELERLESSDEDEEEEVVNQEDIERLKQEVIHSVC
ncbi:uncharacterized protein LOC143284776 isoform X2 [Babylonia areolata]|uniref:uncharacterized protein LOC143284776 isoform X2 n=1 Tax=Babylonia areolata TaxID=304850 RepID=UPI003FD3E657